MRSMLFLTANQRHLYFFKRLLWVMHPLPFSFLQFYIICILWHSTSSGLNHFTWSCCMSPRLVPTVCVWHCAHSLYLEEHELCWRGEMLNFNRLEKMFHDIHLLWVNYVPRQTAVNLYSPVEEGKERIVQWWSGFDGQKLCCVCFSQCKH